LSADHATGFGKVVEYPESVFALTLWTRPMLAVQNSGINPSTSGDDRMPLAPSSLPDRFDIKPILRARSTVLHFCRAHCGTPASNAAPIALAQMSLRKS
jgi:hypothetical protein